MILLICSMSFELGFFSSISMILRLGLFIVSLNFMGFFLCYAVLDFAFSFTHHSVSSIVSSIPEILIPALKFCCWRLHLFDFPDIPFLEFPHFVFYSFYFYFQILKTFLNLLIFLLFFGEGE